MIRVKAGKNVYLAREVITHDNTGVEIIGACQIGSGEDVTIGDCANYQKMKNLDKLTREMVRMDYSYRNLTDEEEIRFTYTTGLFNEAKKTAVARIENDYFDQLLGKQ